MRTLDEEYCDGFGEQPAVSYSRDVASYFSEKTQTILERYGPGPRVHYHTGIVDNPPPSNASAGLLRQRLVDAQERILCHAAKTWDASSALGGDVLDVGCGLGGGAIFWAQEFGANVTAVTCVPSHIDWVRRFAEQAGVASQVKPLLSDASEMPGKNCFDAAVAVDSSGYLPRRKWFHRLAELLRPGGGVFIIDCFLQWPDHEEIFNRHWHTRIGRIDEYLIAAQAAGLQLGSIEDISHRTEHFWTTTTSLMEAEAKERKLSAVEAARYRRSSSAHAMVREGLASGSFKYALMSFSKCE